MKIKKQSMQKAVFSVFLSMLTVFSSIEASTSNEMNNQSESDLPNIFLIPQDSRKLPKLRDPVVVEHQGKWLIVSGSLGNFHDFTHNFNTRIYVYDPKTSNIKSARISNSKLPQEVKKQLASSMPQFLQDGNTLYIIGGFYNEPDTNVYTTINTITAIDIPGMMHAILRDQTNLAPFVAYNTKIPEFRVTGGQIGKIDKHFYLAFGQDCEGRYCNQSQVYTNAIYKFRTDPKLNYIRIIKTEVHNDNDGSGWRRRDYTLTPFILGNKDILFALGGPFQPSAPTEEPKVWTNGIIFDQNISDNSQFINQQGNQYLAAKLPMYSAKKQKSYVATFAGLSNLFWTESGLEYNDTTPWGNIMDLITADSLGNVREYVNKKPLCSGKPVKNCLYMGVGSEFIPASHYYDERFILQLDKLPKNIPTLVGYIYAGMLSEDQEIFPPSDNTTVTNQVYAVYVNPKSSGNAWKNVTYISP